MPSSPALPTGRVRTIAVLVLFVATFMDLLDTTIVNVALPTLGRELDASTRDLLWIVDGSILAFAARGATAGYVFGSAALSRTTDDAFARATTQRRIILKTKMANR